MRGQFAAQTRAQSPKGVGIVLFNRELARQLTVDRFDQLADGIVQMLISRRDLLFLVRAWEGAQRDPIALPQFHCFGGTDIAFVAQCLLVGMFAQEFNPASKSVKLAGVNS